MAKAWMRQARMRQSRGWIGSPEAGALRWAASEAMGDWLARYRWDFFATFTTAPGHGEESLLRVHRKWSGEVHRVHGRQLRQAVFMEGHRDGRPHLHALIAGADQAGHLELENEWTRVSGGIARLRRYVVGGGACEYCVKGTRYVSKEGNVWFLGPWPRSAGV